MNKKLLTAIILTTAAFQVEQASAHLNAKEGEEKCYGVSKAHKNSCASKMNKHSCAGQSKTDNDPNEWTIVKKGECAKMKGSLEPKDKITN